MKNSWLIVLFTLFVCTVSAQEKTYKIASIAFYNVENLFDTQNDPNKNDEEFLPDGANQYTQERYQKKLENLSKVISEIGLEKAKNGVSVLGMSEIENINVIQDLVKMPALAKRNYQIVHYDSPDKRGVDVGLIYNPDHFTVTSSRSARLTVAGETDFFTRDQLVVSGIFDGEPMHFIVNHWPSRRGGEKRSSPLRIAAAQLSRSIADSILKIDPNAKIFIMGDLNDNPTDESLVKHLKAKGDKDKLQPGEFFNPMFNLFKKEGIGSNAYRDSWSLFDQIVMTPEVINKNTKGYQFFKAFVFNQPYMTQQEGAFKGYPLRTYVGSTFQGGYSDHFPAYIYLIKEK